MCRSILVWAFSLMGFCNCFGQAGLLDAGFGTDGKVVTPLSLTNDFGLQANDVVLQPDGKIVIAASSYYELSVNDTSAFFLVRYNVDGSLDTTFGTGGVVKTVINNYIDLAVTLALQPDGKIIAAGSTKFNMYYSDWAMVRYKPNGAVDSTFGVNGLVRTSRSPNNERITSIIIKPDGKILAAGNTLPQTRTEVLQFTANGSIDSSFGTNGVASNAPGFAITGMILQPDDKILVSGDRPNNDTLAVARFTATGQVDSGFGIAGNSFVKFLYEQSHSLTLQPDGKIVVVGGMTDTFNVGRYIAMVRFHANGAVDSSFGRNGKVFSLRGNADDGFRVFVRPDGKLLVIGSKDRGFSYVPRYNGNFAILKYNADGSADSTFGRRGAVLTDFAGKDDEAYSGLIQPDGKIVVVGSTVVNNMNAVALARYESNGLTNYNTLRATVFYDNNLNGTKDSSEPFFYRGVVTTVKVGVDTLSITSNGKYSVEIDTGTYVTKAVPYYPYFNVVPAQFITSHTDYFNNDSVSFAVQPIAGKKDLSIDIVALNVARPGFPLRYKIFYRNNGTDTIVRDTIRLIKSSKLLFNAAFPAADSVKADTLVWILANFKPLDTASITVNLTVKAPPLTKNGDTIQAVVTIKPDSSDVTPADNKAHILQIARGSYDPNDKTESHGGSITAAAIAAGEYLTYTIRFQNTGTDTAFSVYIRDTLSDNLDWNTLQMVSASDDYELEVHNGNQCRWTFSNINLVDSNTNRAASHGYLVYKIKAKNNVSVGDLITNTAAIYFDYNTAVHTNTSATTVVADVLPLRLLSFNAQKQDKQNLLQWRTANEVGTDRFEIEKAVDGREWMKMQNVKSKMQNGSDYSYIDANPVNGMNYYRLKMVDKDGRYSYSNIVTVDNSGGLRISTYPNPAKEVVQLLVQSARKSLVRYVILTTEGKVLLTGSFQKGEGVITKAVNINALPKGTYYLKIALDDKEQAMVKFEKM